MKISLTQTGGLLGLTRTAEAEWSLPAEKIKDLVDAIKMKQGSNAKDGISYFLKTELLNKDIPISISNIPPDYTALFDQLFDKL